MNDLHPLPMPAQILGGMHPPGAATVPNPVPEAAAMPWALASWDQYDALARRLAHPFEGHYRRQAFDYVHPEHLQPRAPARYRRPYPVRVSYLAWGDPSRPLLVCCGGVANVARRFDYLALALADEHYVVCPDWVGRGESGWVHDQGDYSHATCVEQLRQLLVHLGDRPASIIGSSLGATIGIELAAMLAPGRIARLVLNDTGPHIPAGTRSWRAATLARHYVFRSPADMFRRVGAAQKNDGPLPHEVRLHNFHAQTRWSDEEDGRIFRHDPRALQEYQEHARSSVDVWDSWDAIACPVLATRGTETDVLLPQTLQRMQAKRSVTVMHVPATGHTPALADPNHIACIRDWLRDASHFAAEFSSGYALR